MSGSVAMESISPTIPAAVAVAGVPVFRCAGPVLWPQITVLAVTVDLLLGALPELYPSQQRHALPGERGIVRRVAAVPRRLVEHYDVSQGWPYLIEKGGVATPILALRTSPLPQSGVSQPSFSAVPLTRNRSGAIKGKFRHLDQCDQ